MSMTENEAIKELCTSIDLAKMCAQTPERKKEIEAYNTAINALEEIQKYRAIGTVEELQDMKMDYYEALNDWRQYRKIGTIEEFKALKEENTYLHNEMQAIGATIDELETEIRAKAIDEYAEELCNKVSDDSLQVMLPDGFRADVVTVDYVTDIAFTIAEKMKSGKVKSNKCYARACDHNNIDNTCMYGDASKRKCCVKAN